MKEESRPGTRAFIRVMMICAASMVPVLLAAAVIAHVDLIFSDGFESGDTSAWEGIPGPSCTTCHGEGANPAPPPDLDGDTTTAATGVGAHQSHLETSTWHAAMACSECHLVPVTEDDPGHTDTAPPAELVWGALAMNDGATPWWDGASCGGVYCHGATLIPGGINTVPQWTVVDGSEAACGTCHGLPPGAPHTTSSSCFTCHPSLDATGAIIDPGVHIDGVVDVVDLPTISIGDGSVNEGDAGTTTTAAFDVALSGPIGVDILVDYVTSGVTATEDVDYIGALGTVSIPAGATTGTVYVTVNGDDAHEADETFTVHLSNPSNAVIAGGQAEGTILNDDNAPPVAIADAYSMLESTTLITVDPDGMATVGDTNDDGVLANDTDIEGGALTAIQDAGPGSGTLVLNPDGTFEYTPTAGFSGSDSFTYFADDGTTSSVATATVTINVTAVDSRPSVTITQPSDWTVVTLGEAILFEGIAEDDEDGPLSADIEWSETASQPTVELTDSGQALGDAVTVDVALADFDNDGDLDAYVGNAIHSDDTDVSDWVWLNDGSGNFVDSGQRIESALHTVGAPVTTTAVDAGDVNGDGFPDIVINFTATTASLRKPEVWTNNGLGASGDWLGFDRAQTLTQEGGQGIRLGDLDLDGDLDLWVSSGVQDSVWLNDGAGFFVFYQHYSPASDVALGDLDDDGDLDAFVGAVIGPKIFLNSTVDTGTFAFIEGASVAIGSSRSVELGDLDGDGDLDAVLARSGPNSVLFNDGGAFAESGQDLGDRDTFHVMLADLNGDGHLDIFEANTDGSNQIWLNDGSGAFALDPFDGGVVPSRGLALGDLDGDGDEDAFVGNGLSTAPTAEPNEVLFNNLMDSAATFGTGASVMVADLGLGGHTVVARVTDSGGNSETDTIFVHVNGAPVAADDSASVDEGSSVSIEVLVNDSDPDDLLPPTSTVTVVDSPQHGTAVADVETGEIQYTHDDSETMEDSFTYTVADEHGAVSNEATVTITINPMNDNDPVFSSPTTVDVPENSTSVMTVTATDDDLPAQVITYSVTGGADQSLFGIGAVSGALSFLVPPDFEAPTDADADNVYEVEVTADDGEGSTASQTVAVAVTPIAEQNIVVTPASFDFGDVLMGEEPTTSITISNDGDDELVVSSIELSIGSSTDFTLNATAPVTLGTGADTTLEVTYAPTDLGSDVGAIEVSSSDPDEPVLNVPLSGNGFEPTLSINDVTALEGNSGPASFLFSVTLSAASDQIVEVMYETADGTAASGDSDYDRSEDRLVFDPGVTTRTIEIEVNGDIKHETDEEFTVILFDAVNAPIGDGQGRGTITNDDGQPSLTVNDAIRLPEGDTGTTPLEFTVGLSNPSYQTVDVSLVTSDGTAELTDNDYQQVTGGLLLFSPGETSKALMVDINGDTKFETDETLNVSVHSLVHATIADGTATGTIMNDDPVPEVGIFDAGAPEGDDTLNPVSFTVGLSAVSGLDVTMYFTYSPDETTVDQAIPDDDFNPVIPSLTIPAGQLTGTGSVELYGDDIHEADERFLVAIQEVGLENATISSTDGIATVTILDDDPFPTLTIENAENLEGASASSGNLLSFFVALTPAAGEGPYVEDAFIGCSIMPVTAGLGDWGDAPAEVMIDAGNTSGVINVEILGDPYYEDDETLELLCMGVHYGESPSTWPRFDPILPAGLVATGTILNDDTPPTLSISDSFAPEGASMAVFTVTLSMAVEPDVSVDYETVDGTALAGSDYTATSGTLDFTGGDTILTINVPLLDDSTLEPDETFTVVLSNPVHATLAVDVGVGTIGDDD